MSKLFTLILFVYYSSQCVGSDSPSHITVYLPESSSSGLELELPVLPLVSHLAANSLYPLTGVFLPKLPTEHQTFTYSSGLPRYTFSLEGRKNLASQDFTLKPAHEDGLEPGAAGRGRAGRCQSGGEAWSLTSKPSGRTERAPPRSTPTLGKLLVLTLLGAVLALIVERLVVLR